MGHTAQNDHQPVGQDSSAGLFLLPENASRTTGFYLFTLAHNRIHICTSSHFTGFGADSARAQPDFICFGLAHNRIQNYLLADVMVSRAQPELRFFITNRPDVALVAEKYGVDRIWIDLETRGKEQRQHNLNTVKSHHRIADISAIKPLLTRAEMMVRVNSWYEGSPQEIDDVIAAGADVVMLPYWKSVDEVKSFLEAVHGRCRTNLLLETKEAVECIDEVLSLGGFDEIHIGLNDLHLSYGMTFMFEPLSDGIVEMLCDKFKKAGIPYGFGGIAKLGDRCTGTGKNPLYHAVGR